MSDVRAVLYGVGPIGIEIAQVAHSLGIEFRGAIDIDPAKVGADLGRVAGLDESLGVTITDDPTVALNPPPDVVFHATESHLTAVHEQLTTCLDAGASVVSTTEELSYPWWQHESLAARLDRCAHRNDVSLLGTGINPGYAMDYLPAVLSLASRRVDTVTVRRVQDAGVRREPLQRKIGCGQSVEFFDREVRTTGGHVGLAESAAMLAAGLGWALDRFDTTIEPVVASTPLETEHVTVDVGDVAGITQRGIGFVDGHRAVELDLEMAIGATDPYDQIELTGDPDVTVRNETGFHGDRTTPAIVVNVAEGVIAARAGLLTMLDVAPGMHRASVKSGHCK